LGARIQELGLRKISIFGKEHAVRARIAKIEAFSGHGDYNEMKSFLKCQDCSQIKRTFLVHGEFETQKYYQNELLKLGFKNIEIPQSGQEFIL
jgi:metallo-beta-lactamase family protein